MCRIPRLQYDPLVKVGIKVQRRFESIAFGTVDPIHQVPSIGSHLVVASHRHITPLLHIIEVRHKTEPSYHTIGTVLEKINQVHLLKFLIKFALLGRE